ncbi:MAG: rRNA maturation RNase YbeY [Hyphomicrobiaceae bacterium]
MTARNGKGRTSDHGESGTSVEVIVDHGAWVDRVDADRLVELARAAAGNRRGDIAISLSSDQSVQNLNRTYRDLDKPTNVLSFPGAADDLGHGIRHLGDVILAFETSVKEASELGIELADHAAHLVVHGVLHLLGHDHQTEGEAETMEAEERRVLAGFGISDPYARQGDVIMVAEDG